MSTNTKQKLPKEHTFYTLHTRKRRRPFESTLTFRNRQPHNPLRFRKQPPRRARTLLPRHDCNTVVRRKSTEADSDRRYQTFPFGSSGFGRQLCRTRGCSKPTRLRRELRRRNTRIPRRHGTFADSDEYDANTTGRNERASMAND